MMQDAHGGSPMQLQDVIESTGTCRFYRPDPVPDDMLRRVLDAARYAPSGGNRQPVRFVVVREAQKKRQLQEWYLPIWKAYVARMAQHAATVSPRAGLLARA